MLVHPGSLEHLENQLSLAFQHLQKLKSNKGLKEDYEPNNELLNIYHTTTNTLKHQLPHFQRTLAQLRTEDHQLQQVLTHLKKIKSPDRKKIKEFDQHVRVYYGRVHDFIEETNAFSSKYNNSQRIMQHVKDIENTIHDFFNKVIEIRNLSLQMARILVSFRQHLHEEFTYLSEEKMVVEEHFEANINAWIHNKEV